MVDRPKFENAPGMRLRRMKDKWEASWRPRTDLVGRGYPASPQRLWVGIEPTDTERQWVSERANFMQSEMLTWARGGVPEQATFDGTLRSLIRCYETDPDSSVHKLRYMPRLVSSRNCARIAAAYGDLKLEEIKARQFLRWHEEWTKAGVAMAHDLVGKLRTVIRFGAVFLENEECERLTAVLHGMRFKMPKARTERLTYDQAQAIRRVCHACGYHSIALAQVIQFELMLRQKDVIGEWVPQSEPGLSLVTRGTWKWLRGVVWEEIDDSLVLRHNTSKKGKDLVIDLKLAPMVMDEFRYMIGAPETDYKADEVPELPDLSAINVSRDLLPRSGPIIIAETVARPWEPAQFRTTWRRMANLAGVPKTVKNMDSRAGGISEATDAGAPLEHVRHAATHSDTAMTQKYSRGDAEKIAEVQRRRIEHRNKK